MRIRALIVLTVGATLAATLLLAVVAWRTTERLKDLGDLRDAVYRTTQHSADLFALTQEYLRHAEERPLVQWRERHAAVAADLARVERTQLATMPAFADAKADHAFAGEVFAKLSEDRREPQTAAAMALEARRRDLLADRLSIAMLSMLANAAELREAAVTRDLAARRQGGAAIIAVTLLLLVAIVITTAALARRLGAPLARLREGMAEVGAGRLGYRFAIDRDDEIGALARTINDTVARLQAITASRDELEQAQARLRSIVETANDSIIVIDADGIIESVNRATERTFGYPAAELVGRNISLLMPSPEREHHDGHLRRYRESGKARIIGIGREVLAQRRDGSVFPAEISISEMLLEGKRRFTGLLHDITERKQAEARLQELNAQLEQRVAARTASLEAANKELESFSYSVSHDLRGPLRQIAGFAQILAEEYGPRLDAEAQRLIGIITDRTSRMQSLIEDLLAFSRSARLPIAARPIDMNRLVQEVLDELLGKGETCVQTVVTPLPEGRGEPVLMRQVVINLLSNAIKFSGRRPDPKIEVGGREEDAETVYFVRDNGVGFDMRYYDKLFGVFQRLHERDAFPGTGAGLAIVQRLILRHGGRIWAESVVDEGAVFYFTLPKERGNGQ